MSDKPITTLTTHFTPDHDVPPLDAVTLEFCARLCEGRRDTLNDAMRIAEAESCASAIRKHLAA